jgi:hypothetical protein
MKKIFGILGLVLSIFVFAACSDDDTTNPYAEISTISVDSSSVLFQAAPSTGVIKVKATNGITKVVSEQSWCTATINGSQIDIAVAQNNNLMGRSSQVTIYSGEDYTKVTVQQMGIVFALEAGTSIKVNDNAHALKYYMKHNTDVTLSSSADWFTVSGSADSLKVNMTANNTGHMRTGYVYYVAGTTKDSVKVVQYDFDKDIAGDYYLLFTQSASSTSYQYFAATVSATSITLPDVGLTIPSTFDDANISIDITCGQYCGPYSKYYVYDAFMLAGGYWTAYYANTTAYGAFDHSDTDSATVCPIYKSTNDRAFLGIQFCACSSQSFSKSTYLGYLWQLYNVTLVKYDPTAAKKGFFSKAVPAKLN